MIPPRAVRLLDVGRAPYGPIHRLQRTLHAAVAAGRERDAFIAVEHDAVITLGRDAKASNVLLSRETLAASGIEVCAVERGGDVTYHGPGQVVIYPIMKLERFREVLPLVSTLERAVIDALSGFGIAANSRPEHRGVYVGEKAICAIGLAVQRMTTLHGIALNVATSLDYNRLILPCGKPEFGITSVSEQAGVRVPWAEGRDALLVALERAFNIRFVAEPVTDQLQSAS